MTIRDWFKGRKVDRNLLVGGIIFVVFFPYKVFVVPLFPALGGQLLDALAAGALALVAWWIVYRWWKL